MSGGPDRKWTLANWEVAKVYVMINLANNREHDAMTIIYDVLTDDLAATADQSFAEPHRIVNDVDALIEYFGKPELEEYERCAKLQELKRMLDRHAAERELDK